MIKQTLPLSSNALGELSSAATGPITRPTNYTRSLFHAFSGLFALTLLRVLPGRGALIAVSGAFAVSAWSMEVWRRHSVEVNQRLMKIFAPVAHPHERHRVNSSTWYTTALVLMAVLAPLRAAELGVIILAVADPMAGLVGRRWGRTRLRAGRSLEGTLGFVVAGTLAAGVWLMAVDAMPLHLVVILAGGAAVAGALAELLTVRLDDNFTIPLAVAMTAAVTPMLMPL